MRRLKFITVLVSLALATGGCTDSDKAEAHVSRDCGPGAQVGDLCASDSAGADLSTAEDAGLMDATPPDAQLDALMDPLSDVGRQDASLLPDLGGGERDLGVLFDGGSPPGRDGSSPAPCLVGFGNGQIMRDLPYANGDARQAIDLYLTDAPGPNPLLIWIHGGGWRGGSKDRVVSHFLDFRERGYSVASIGYRLSDSPWPTTVSDVKAAVRFLRARSERYAIDPDRFVAIGSSAGGHLVSMLGVSAGVELFSDDSLGHADVSDEVHAVVNFFGPTDLDEMDNDARVNGCPENALCHDCAGSPETRLIDCRPSQCTDLADQASPVHYVDGTEPPFMTFHGQEDCTVPTPQGRRLHDALVAAGDDSILVEVPAVGHNVDGCLRGENLLRMQAFIESVIRGCSDAHQSDNGADVPEGSVIGSCLWRQCPERAAACEENPVCLALEICFQDCFRRELGNCIPRCLDEVPQSADGRVQHQPLFECGFPQGCYPEPR